MDLNSNRDMDTLEPLLSFQICLTLSKQKSNDKTAAHLKDRVHL
jgi:hypothetical protein